jgi:xanthine dehydrogenase YagR molybdenum-binding subunit
MTHDALPDQVGFLGIEGTVKHSAKKGTQYDARTSRIANRNIVEDSLGRNADVPTIDLEFLNRPDPQFNLIGARGIGKIGITGTPAMIANAAHHVIGKRIRQLPIRSWHRLS